MTPPASPPIIGVTGLLNVLAVVGTLRTAQTNEHAAGGRHGQSIPPDRSALPPVSDWRSYLCVAAAIPPVTLP